jgi:hypothetical protein
MYQHHDAARKGGEHKIKTTVPENENEDEISKKIKEEDGERRAL